MVGEFSAFGREMIKHSLVAEFNHTVIQDHEKPWYPTLDDAYDLKACFDKCDKTYGISLTKRSVHKWRKCISLSKKLHKCIEDCNEQYGNEEESKMCIQEYCNKRTVLFMLRIWYPFSKERYG
ncbi:hypothetical protein PIB30_053527 [Stylosanthes scabra]|uniref:Uncharacterized protein n=1 Tax=Stylosanthes scabra TaxID=79078 RepID=A0ABU6VKW8_9FABA|nr:hypothetical protein [Stylosanthes scabra]